MGIKKNKKIVFIVEDNDAYRILIGRMLEQRGFSVLMFRNGVKALEMLQYIIPSIILSDIEMPVMDGFMLYEKINELYPNTSIPFQYISSTSKIDVIEKANVLSVHKLVKKPVQAEELSNILTLGINKFAEA
ncbi:MAG: response regulator [Balneola sp.]